MIGYIEGEIIHEDIDSVIVRAGGVGYKVYVATSVRDGLNKAETKLWTYLAVREQALDLYGFSTREELSLFELLLTVSGIGPKSALAILSVAKVSTLKHAIASGDTSHLTSVSGIGKKVAEKVVLELKDKILDAPSESSPELRADVEALEALKALGYKESEARDALREVPADITTTNERITAALKQLG